MKYNEQTRLIEAEEGKVISLDNKIFVKFMYLAESLTLENVIEIDEKDIPIEEIEENLNTIDESTTIDLLKEEHNMLVDLINNGGI